MKKLVVALLMAMLLCLAVGCSSKGSPTAATGGASASTSSSASQSATLPEKNGFDEATNKTVTVTGVDFSLPAYFEESSSSDKRLMYQVKADDGSVDNLLILFYMLEKPAASTEKYEAIKDNAIVEGLESSNDNIKNVKIEKKEEGTIAGLPSGIYTLSGTYKSKSGNVNFKARSATFLNSSLKYAYMYFVQMDGAKYDYFSDFDRILGSAKVTEQAQAPAEAAGVSPDLKATLDSYEVFVDEYIAFMQKYKESSNAASLMADYATYMQKYADLMSKINAMDTKTMSAADAAYYLEVTTRVSTKLINAAV